MTELVSTSFCTSLCLHLPYLLLLVDLCLQERQAEQKVNVTLRQIKKEG